MCNGQRTIGVLRNRLEFEAQRRSQENRDESQSQESAAERWRPSMAEEGSCWSLDFSTQQNQMSEPPGLARASTEAFLMAQVKETLGPLALPQLGGNSNNGKEKILRME